MKTYNVIEISTQNIVFSDTNYDSCVDWLENNGNLLEYTIIEL